jgi:hypothetical protein
MTEPILIRSMLGWNGEEVPFSAWPEHIRSIASPPPPGLEHHTTPRRYSSEQLRELLVWMQNNPDSITPDIKRLMQEMTQTSNGTGTKSTMSENIRRFVAQEIANQRLHQVVDQELKKHDNRALSESLGKMGIPMAQFVNPKDDQNFSIMPKGKSDQVI